jgi:hypothetical protein
MKGSNGIHTPESARVVPGIIEKSLLCLNGLSRQRINLPLNPAPRQPDTIKTLTNIGAFSK